MCRKNSKISGALREKGNLSYAQGDLDAALQFYNQALQFADTGEDLSTALANRSAVWTDKKRWSLAVRDIDLALDNNYPEGLKYKVLERKATCLFLKGGQDNVEEGKRCVANAIEALKSSKLTDGKRKAKEGQLENLKDTLKPERGNENEKSLVFDLPKLKDTHEQFPSFSSSVAVRYEEGRGRFCVAAKKIEIGELIAVETPFVAMLDRSEVRSLCWHCFRALLSPLPCRKCSGVLFCGPQCTDIATSRTVQLLSDEMHSILQACLKLREPIIRTNVEFLTCSTRQIWALGPWPTEPSRQSPHHISWIDRINL